MEPYTPVYGEPTVGYHPFSAGVLTLGRGAGQGTVSGGQFDWGGHLLKGNGGAQRSSQDGWEPSGECKGRRGPDCERDTSSRDESRA